MSRLLLIVLVSFVFALGTPVGAFADQSAAPEGGAVSAFRQYLSVSPQVSVPTVVEVPLDQALLTLPVLAVYDETTGGFEPYLLNAVTRGDTPAHASAQNALGNPGAVNDGNYATYLEFRVQEGTARNDAEITLTFDRPITSSSLSFALDHYVALPQTISISADTANGAYIVLAPMQVRQTSVSFPKTTAQIWHVSFTYAQPLRITEMRFSDASSGTPVARNVRFLAQPGQSYRVYLNADRYVPPTQKEAGNLASNEGVVTVRGSGPFSNTAYVPADSDHDGVPDLIDTCVSVPNPDQQDSDRNGRGDACEDYDRDGVPNALDNCISIPNRDQADVDADRIGDACDDLDNRVTERMPWLPWVGIGAAGVVVFVLFVFASKHKREDGPTDASTDATSGPVA